MLLNALAVTLCSYDHEESRASTLRASPDALNDVPHYDYHPRPLLLRKVVDCLHYSLVYLLLIGLPQANNQEFPNAIRRGAKQSPCRW